MRILLTNDDGIHAEGLAVLERIARKLSDDVWVVAPETDQSGLAHSLTLSEPLRLRQIDERHFALRGTPTDCVIMGVRHVLPDAPDLVLSGVNSGANLADDVTYSGTVAGAIEGTLQGVRSMALSQAYRLEGGRVVPWEVVEAYAPKLLPGFNVELIEEEKLVLVRSTVDRQEGREPDYVHVDWGSQFAGERGFGPIAFTEPSLRVGLGLLGLNYILRAGGMGYFRKGVVAAHVEAGELELVENAPQFVYPAYAVYPESAEGRGDIQEALHGLKQVAH